MFDGGHNGGYGTGESHEGVGRGQFPRLREWGEMVGGWGMGVRSDSTV